MYAYIARQPIYNYEKKIAGYELLYRDGSGNAARIVDTIRFKGLVPGESYTVAGTLFDKVNEQVKKYSK